jgi:hypothetical protein
MQAQLEYTTNDGSITITGYSGGGAVTIPTNIDGLIVTSIAAEAFSGSSLTSVTIPPSVTTIGEGAFAYSGLTGITIPGSVIDIGSDAFAECTSLTNATLGNGVPSVGVDMFASCELLACITIPASVGSIGQYAFESCSSLTNITIPASVVRLQEYAFEACSSLAVVSFEGNAPAADSSVFSSDANATAYYLPGTIGWGEFSANTDLPTLLWNAVIQTGADSFGVSNNQFGFNIFGTSNIPVIVEACQNLVNPDWTSLASLTLTNGLFAFKDLEWTNYPARFYRIRLP